MKVLKDIMLGYEKNLRIIVGAWKHPQMTLTIFQLTEKNKIRYRVMYTRMKENLLPCFVWVDFFNNLNL